MTRKLFWENPYQTECKAKICSIDGNIVKLEETIFFAFSGGQESDSGTIGGIPVKEAIKEGDKEAIIDIKYVLEKEPDFKVGDEVEVKIDKERRQALMKLHAALHIIYYVITEKFGGMKVVGSHVSQEKARVDFATDKELSEEIEKLEEGVNEFLFGAHVIKREQDKNNPDLWWWICENWKMPCGGTHVKSTEEIGKIKLKRKTKGSGKERIEVYLVN